MVAPPVGWASPSPRCCTAPPPAGRSRRWSPPTGRSTGNWATTTRAYFLEEISPRLGPDVWLFGEAEAPAKRDLLSRAHCLAFPVCWEEPFGMVLVEALACGTPVVALGRGSVPEIVIDGVCGVVCEQPAELPAAIEAAGPSA
jgi:glycosyltransferase involved in cell wall biosynthesis